MKSKTKASIQRSSPRTSPSRSTSEPYLGYGLAAVAVVQHRGVRLLVLQLVPPLGRLEVGLEPRRGAATPSRTRTGTRARPHPGRPRHARRHRCVPASNSQPQPYRR